MILASFTYAGESGEKEKEKKLHFHMLSVDKQEVGTYRTYRTYLRSTYSLPYFTPDNIITPTRALDLVPSAPRTGRPTCVPG